MVFFYITRLTKTTKLTDIRNNAKSLLIYRQSRPLIELIHPDRPSDKVSVGEMSLNQIWLLNPDAQELPALGLVVTTAAQLVVI